MSREYQPDEFLDPRTPLVLDRHPSAGRTSFPPCKSETAHPAGQVIGVPRSSQERRYPRTIFPEILFGPSMIGIGPIFCTNPRFHTLTELGKFRVIAGDDVARYAYAGNRSRMDRELRNLIRQSLVQEKRFEMSVCKAARMFTLTKAGRRLLLKSESVPTDQAIYYGLVKPKEVKHDAQLYRLYQKEAARIAASGGRVRQVMLDYELKQKLNRDLARPGQEKNAPDTKREVAERHGLHVVRGRIPVPDLRIEYETPEQGIARLDLELSTSHYRPRQLAEKARAGFKLYTHTQDASRLRRILNDRELTAEILSL